MYLLVEMKDNKIIWMDSKIAKTKRELEARKQIIKKQTKKDYNVIKLTKYQLVS